MISIEEAEIDAAMSWPRVIAAITLGHRLAKPKLGDVLLTLGPDKMLTRAAWVEGLGAAIKSVTVFPGNVNRTPAVPSIQGRVLLFDKDTGSITASLEGAAVTRWKTAGDSALGSQLLSRPDAKMLLMVGAGTMAEPLIRAHVSVRPSIEAVAIWNRTGARAESVASRLGDLGRTVRVAGSLEASAREADIISCATMTSDPVIRGAWLKPGAHLDLVGAYNMDMRETDDEAMRRGRIFVDFRETTIGHIAEITVPIRTGVIRKADVLGDLYDLVPGGPGRQSDSDITIYKNGGGAHLDLMTALAVVEGHRKA